MRDFLADGTRDYIRMSEEGLLDLGWFTPHYGPNSGITPDDVINRFWSNVEIGGPDDCWPYKGHVNEDGYGVFGVGQLGKARNFLAHRFAYMMRLGLIENQILHRCNNPPCTNTDHLYDGDHSDNARDKIATGIGIGENHPGAKLTEQAVREIRSVVRDLVSKHDISFRTVRDIVERKTWRHI